MKKLLLLGTVASSLVIGGISLSLRPIEAKHEEKDATIIVRLDDNVSKQTVLRKIRNTITPNVDVESEYSALFNGFVLNVPSKYVSDIRYLSGVDEIDYNKPLVERNLGDGIDYEASLGIVDSTASSLTMQKPEGTNDGSGTFIAVLDNGFYLHYDAEGTPVFHHVYSPLQAADAVVTQASLKAKIDATEGFHGKYDEDHSTYYNTKVPFYYDYGGDASGRMEADYDVYAEGQDHGTHVSSIAAGNAGEEYEGIAPKAQLALMKVFSTYMEGQEYKSRLYPDALLNALEDCVALDVDVVNMSLGSDLDDFDDGEIVQDVIRSLEAKGTFVCVAAGNSGKGEWAGNALRYWGTDMVETNIISSYANNMATMTVASTQADTQFFGAALMVNGVNVKYADEVTNYRSTSGDVVYEPQRYLSDLVTKYEKSEFEFVKVGGLGEEADYANIDVNGKIAVVDRGTTTFREKVEIATAHGAVAILIINNEQTVTEFNMRMSFGDDNFTPDIPVCFVLYGNRDSFTNPEVTTCRIVQNEELPNPDTKTISEYSSDGMRYDLSIKPEISTPGENIKGAVLGDVDKYESMSGTSMASPNYAGAVALMISEHLGDADYRKTINTRLMSTAVPMMEIDKSGTHASVRRQGAGLVNLDAALNSDVYLDGVDAEGNRLGKAKVELKNNDDIKVGKLNLKFAAINEGNDTVTYTATTYVYAPKIMQYDETSYPELAGTDFQAIQDKLLETFVDSVTVAPGTSIITIPEHELSAESKEYLTKFDYGSIIEGYVILTAENKKQLSVPFLGYYGDLAGASPFEPFTFEREEGRVYTSDTLNYFLQVSLIADDYRKANYNSMMLEGYYPDYKKINVDDAVIYNKASLDSYADANGNTLRSVGQNPYTGEYDKNNIFMGNNGYSNTLIIQQYMIRSAKDNAITIVKKSDGSVIATEHLEDSLFGPETDPTSPGVALSYPLYKSHFDYTALYEAGYMAHRAVGIVPIYSIDSKKNVTPYPDGEYELVFTYELAAGSTYVKKYNLTINSDVPAVSSIDSISSGDKNYTRFNFLDKTLSVVDVNGTKYQPVVTNDGAYIDVDMSASAFQKDDTVYVKSENISYAKDGFLTRLNDENRVMIRHNLMSTEIYSYNYTVENEDTASQVFTFSFTKNGAAYSPKGDISYTMLIPEGLDAASLKLYTVSASGSEKELKFTKNGDFISFSTGTKTIHFASNGATPTPPEPGPGPEPEPTPSKGGCGGSIAATSIILSTTALLSVVLLLVRKHKED